MQKQFKIKKYDWLNIYYNDESDFDIVFNEYFIRDDYDLFKNLQKTNPVIIDCGANCGISVLAYKYKYPDSQVIAFEPDPESFALLKKNVEANRLSNVTLYNIALSKDSGELEFYLRRSIGSLGNSLYKDFTSLGTDEYELIKISAERLSSFIVEPVDYLKIDIEGAEYDVIYDLMVSNKLSMVQRLVVEVHEGETFEDRFNELIDHLRRTFRVVTVQNVGLSLLPEKLTEFFNKKDIRLSIVSASM